MTRRPNYFRRSAVLATLAAVLLVPACSSNNTSADPTSASPTTAETAESDLFGTLTVFGAASLREVLEEIGTSFTDENSNVEITYSFAGSSDLVAQIEGGAPADVLVTADENNMTKAEEKNLIEGAPLVVASNTLTLVTAPGNPKGITGLDASLDGADLVICAPQVPCGRATATITENEGVTLKPVSEENSVSDVLGKVTSGQADAGVVYVTDATLAGDKVTTVDIVGADKVVNYYPAAVVAGSQNQDLARRFVTYLGLETAQDALAAAGFGQP